MQDFSPNESKNYTLTRNTENAGDKIELWAHIKVPEGFIDKNPENNTATAVIRVLEKPKPSPGKDGDPKDEPEPDKDEPGENPTPEDIPDPEKLCDVSAGIIAPPTVYEGENYRFTVSFTNHSDIELKAVPLQAKNNEVVLMQTPQTVSFKAQETKSFTVTGQAGAVGEVYNLWTSIGVHKRLYKIGIRLYHQCHDYRKYQLRQTGTDHRTAYCRGLPATIPL